MMYGLETAAMTKRQLGVAEIRMLQFSRGVTRMRLGINTSEGY